MPNDSVLHCLDAYEALVFNNFVGDEHLLAGRVVTSGLGLAPRVGGHLPGRRCFPLSSSGGEGWGEVGLKAEGRKKAEFRNPKTET
jgi:hypothetical protein